MAIFQGGANEMVAAQQTNDFMILGPAMTSGSKVLNAVHALYFLPENFKLILAGSEDTDQSFYNEVTTLVERDGLGDRVKFEANADDSTQAVILPNLGMSRAVNAVSGNSPEALASAILNVARA